MSDQIDQALSSLSPEELNVLNNDPQMQADFKAKYSQPSVMDQVKDIGTSALKTTFPVASTIADAYPTVAPIADKAMKLPSIGIGGLASLATGTSLPDAAEQVHQGKTTGDVIASTGKAHGFPATGKTLGFFADTALNPATWAAMGEKLIPDSVTEGLPGLLRKAASIPEKATELKGFNEKIPTQSEIEQAVQNVQDTVEKVWKEHGDLLNKAKAGAGIPTTEDEVAASVRKYGNEFGLDLNKPLNQPKNLKTMAPTMEEGTAGPVHESGVQAYLKGTMGGGTSPNTGQPLPKTNIWGVRGEPNTLEVMFGDSAPGSVPEDVLKSKGIQLPGQTQVSNMPYTIGEHDTPQQLMTEINRFKANLPYIDKGDQVKAAEYFKDQIVQQGVFKQDIAKGRTLGVLKSQFGDLSSVTHEASPELQAAKSKMGDLYDTMKDVNKKLSAGPGKAESYLRTLFTSKSASVKDDLKALTKLDTLAGSNTVETLFKKFAGEAYGQTLGQSVHTIFQAPYAMLTSPRLLGAAQRVGPGVLKGLKFGAIGAGEGNMSALQSIRDRLQNAQQ